ncbi:ArsR/SmtB family transcription factor [Streptomyces luteolus]|uniref:Helix-turn-helix domain-containing protein n=1 Tax=Streptomyces luteolus TaxID=3043615 RepID=A0ABT6TBN6_9ACTN|nr:helix-turn-helix domain-containing protein [Streptomyces sp. B-S-A12]MDI3424302.1 helix-turn-helix domain-containing protein [Streptomyces sp. B-S-A12]
MKPLSHPRAEDINIYAVLHALAEPARMKIVQTLAAADGRPCGTFGINLSKSTLSAHFKVLREAGVIRQETGPGNARLNTLRRAELNARFPGLLDSVLQAVEESDPALASG